MREDGETAVQRLLEQAGRRVFALDGPLVEAALARTDAEEWVFLLTAHHLVVDGWSFDILWRDLEILYRDRVAGGGLSLPPRSSPSPTAPGGRVNVSPRAETGPIWPSGGKSWRGSPTGPDRRTPRTPTVRAAAGQCGSGASFPTNCA